MSKVCVYFSFRSPFSWLAIEKLRRTVPDALQPLHMVPFWEPDETTASALGARQAAMHYVPMSKAKHLYILEDTKRLAARLGVKMAWPVDAQPWWEPAHLGWLQARRLGRADAFYDAVVEARWGHGRNISDPDVIRTAAIAAGVDADAIGRAVTDPEIRAEGVECLARAYTDDVFGVPYFRCGRQRFWGFDRVDGFCEALQAGSQRRNGERAPGSASVPAGSSDVSTVYDRDLTGGCG
jgi:2-hydroxychromene-2-carboxylate isomerase